MVVLTVLFTAATGEISRSPAFWLGLKQIRDEVEMQQTEDRLL